MLLFNQGPRSEGFTLIELMIVIAIVAILVALAVPAYNNYIIRAKVTDCINTIAVAKLSISEYRQTMGDWPPSAEQAGIVGAGASKFCNMVRNYSPSTGEFTIDIDETAVDSTIAQVEPRMTPTIATSFNIDWNCTVGLTAAASVKYLPSSCRDS